MKKYYYITILALLVVTLLQGYNVSLQYKEYIYNEIDKINSALKVSVDEEYAIRAHQSYNPHKDRKQRVYYKQMSEEDFLKAKPKKEDVIRFNEINIQDLRDRGIAETEAEAMGLLTKDRLTAKGNPINLAKLSRIFKKSLNEGFTYTLLILDENLKSATYRVSWEFTCKTTKILLLYIFLGHNRNVVNTKFPYPIKRLEVIRWFNQKSMVFNQSLS